MFASLSSSSISLATVTPSLVTVGEPQDFSRMTLRPRGPRVTLTVFASRLRPVAIELRALVEKTISLAAIFRFLSGIWLLEHGQHVVLAEDQVLGAVNLDV